MTLYFRRRTLYYFSNLILPCVIIGKNFPLFICVACFWSYLVGCSYSPISASLAVFGFCVPPDSGEKVTLEITVLMSLTFYLNQVRTNFRNIYLNTVLEFQVSAMQPPSSDTPLIGIYFSCIMVIVAVSVVTTIMVLNFHHRAQAANCDMPPWIKAVFLQWLPWILRLERPGGEEITPRAIMMENKVGRSESQWRARSI